MKDLLALCNKLLESGNIHPDDRELVKKFAMQCIRAVTAESSTTGTSISSLLR